MEDDAFTSRQLAALAHPARLRIVRMLIRSGPSGLPAGRLGETQGIPSNALTFHLQKLAQAGLVSRRREGQFIFYRAEFDTLLGLMDALVGACCADAPDKCGPRCPSNGDEP